MKIMKSLMVCLLALAFTASHAQTADEVITKYINALGGADALHKINSVVLTGNINQGGQKIPLKISLLNNKGVKVEYTFNGLTGYQIITDKAGWNFNPFQGQTKPEPMTDDDVKQSKDQLDATDDLLDYAKKGYSVESLGTDDVEGTDCYKLKLTTSGGKEKTIYIGTEDNMMVKKVEKSTINGKEIESASMYSNFKKVGDLVMAFTQVNANIGEITFDTIEVNVPIDEKIFAPPL